MEATPSIKDIWDLEGSGPHRSHAPPLHFEKGSLLLQLAEIDEKGVKFQVRGSWRHQAWRQ